MKKLALAVGLLLLCCEPAVRAQQSASLKAEVYSTFVSQIIAVSDSIEHRKTASVVLMPMPGRKAGNYGIRSLLYPHEVSDKQALRQLTPAPTEKAVLGGLPPAVGPAAKAVVSPLYQWLIADTARFDMVRQLDLLERNTNVLADAVQLPGCRVIQVAADSAQPAEWQDIEAYNRRNPGNFGVMTLSDISFTRDARFAVFRVGTSRGELNGVGYFVFMEKTTAGWRTKFTRMLWIS